MEKTTKWQGLATLSQQFSVKTAFLNPCQKLPVANFFFKEKSFILPHRFGNFNPMISWHS
jgi:hypothetical protein